MRKLTIAYSENYLRWQLGKNHPTNPVRAELAVGDLRDKALAGDWDLQEIDPALDVLAEAAPVLQAIADAKSIHDPDYVDRVLRGECGEWGRKTQPVLGTTALEMMRGTTMLVREMEKAHREPGGGGVYFNPQGAKHHAKFARSSGFCVFNDMAWAAKELADFYGDRIAYLDWDAHHGDGVEELLLDDPRCLTYSIHDGTIFPGTGKWDDEERLAFNDALDAGAGDEELLASAGDFLSLMEGWKPKVLLLATGADGLDEDPLSTLRYTEGGYRKAARGVAAWAVQMGIPVLIGGAGGYTPYDGTPRVWSAVVEEFVEAVA